MNADTSEAWTARPVEGTALAEIHDENGLLVGTVIREDAPLVAAAPRLLAALKLAAQALQEAADKAEGGDEDGRGFYRSALIEARAAAQEAEATP